MVSIITQDKFDHIIEIPMAKHNQGTFVVITPKREFLALYNIEGITVKKHFKSLIKCAEWFKDMKERKPRSVKITIQCDGSDLFRNIEALLTVYEIKHMKKYDEVLSESRVKAIMIAVPRTKENIAILEENPRLNKFNQGLLS